MGYSSYCTSRPQHVCWPVLPPHSYHARVTSAVVKTSYHAFKTLHVSRGDGPAFRDARLFTFRSMETSLAKTKVKKTRQKNRRLSRSNQVLVCFAFCLDICALNGLQQTVGRTKLDAAAVETFGDPRVSRFRGSGSLAPDMVGQGAPTCGCDESNRVQREKPTGDRATVRARQSRAAVIERE